METWGSWSAHRTAEEAREAFFTPALGVEVPVKMPEAWLLPSGLGNNLQIETGWSSHSLLVPVLYIIAFTVDFLKSTELLKKLKIT